MYTSESMISALFYRSEQYFYLKHSLAKSVGLTI